MQTARKFISNLFLFIFTGMLVLIGPFFLLNAENLTRHQYVVAIIMTATFPLAAIEVAKMYRESSH